MIKSPNKILKLLVVTGILFFIAQPYVGAAYAADESASASAKEWADKAYKADAAGKYDEAIEYADKAIQINPDYAGAYNARGYARYKKKLFKEAIEDYDMTIKLKPDFPAAYTNRGSAKFFLGLFDGCIEDQNMAIKLSPDYGNAYFFRAKAYHEKKLYDQAIADYSRALEIEPLASRYNCRADAYLGKGEHGLAVKDIKDAILLAPENYELKAKLARLVGKAPAEGPLGQPPPGDSLYAITSQPSGAEPPAGPGPTPTPSSSSVTAPSEGARVLTPFTGYAVSEICEKSTSMLSGVPWEPGAPQNGATVGSSELGQYEALLRHTMQGLRMLYGSLSPEEDKSFNAFWAPFFDHPTQAALEYFKQITPLLDEMIVALNDLDGMLSNLGTGLEEMLLASGDPSTSAAGIAAAEYQEVKDQRAKIDDLRKRIEALGNPPNPLAAKCRARKRHKQILRKVPESVAEAQPAAVERQFIAEGYIKGWWVLKESWEEHNKQNEDHIFPSTVWSEPVIQENSAHTSSWYAKPLKNDPGLVKFAHSWSSPPEKIRAPWIDQTPPASGEEHCSEDSEKGERLFKHVKTFKIMVEVHNEGSNSKEGYAYTDANWYDMLRRGTFKNQRDDAKNRVSYHAGPNVEASASLSDKQSAKTTGEIESLAVPPRTIPPGGLEAIFKVTVSEGSSGGSTYYRYEFEPDDSPDNDGNVYKEGEARAADYDQAKKSAEEASSEEDDANARNEAIDQHAALAEQIRRDAARWTADAKAEKDPRRREELEKRSGEMYANAQAEQDIADSLRTGIIVHTRTEWDERQHQALVDSAKKEIAVFAVENKLLANIPKVGDMVAGIDGVELREQAQKRISDAIKSPDRLQKLAAIYGELQNKVVDQGEQQMATEQTRVDMWDNRVAIAENVQFAASVSIMLGALWAPAEIGSLAIGYAGSTGFAEGGVKGATVAIARSASMRADVLISAYEGATQIDPNTHKPYGVWGAVEGALWSFGTNKAFEKLSGRIQKAKADYAKFNADYINTDHALSKQGAGGPGFKPVAKAKGEARIKEYDFKTPEQRYQEAKSSANTPQGKAAVDKKYAIQAEREKIKLEMEGAKQKAENDIRQGLDPAKAKESYNKDLDAINKKYEASETRNKEHLEVAEKLGFDTKEQTPEQKKAGIDNRDLKPTGSTPKNAASDMDFTLQDKTPHEAYQKGKRYVEEMKKRGHSVDEYGDRWVDNTTDSTIWKPGFDANKPGSSSFEAEVIFGTLPHSDKIATPGGIESVSSPTHATGDPVGAVLAHAGKASGAGLGNSRPKDLHTIGKSASKCLEALKATGCGDVEIDPKMKKQIDGLRKHLTPEQLGIVELGADPAAKDKQVKDFLGKIEALMGRVYGSAKTKSEQNFRELQQKAKVSEKSDAAYKIRLKVGTYKASNDAALKTIAQASPGLGKAMSPAMKVSDLTSEISAGGKNPLNFGGFAREIFRDRESAATALPPPVDSKDPAFAGLGKRCKEGAKLVSDKLAAAKPGSEEARYLTELKTALEQGSANPAEAVRSVRGLSGTELAVVLAQLGVPAKSAEKKAQ